MGTKKKKINGKEYKESEIGFIKSKLMAIKVIAEIQKDYLERCRNENIDIKDDDLGKIGYQFDIDDKIKKLGDLINEMDNVLNTEKELQEFIDEYEKITGKENKKEMKKNIAYRGGPMKYQVPSSEKFKQFFWKTSDLLHTLIINDGQNKKRIMHNPVYLFDEDTIYYYKIHNGEIREALDNGNYNEDYVKAMKTCFKENRITETSCVIIDKRNITTGFCHELDTENRQYLYGNIFLKIPTFYGHEGKEEIDKWGAGICTDNHYYDPCEEDSISHRCLFVSEKDNDGLIKIEKYEKGFSQKKPKRVGVFYICPNEENREMVEKKNKKIAELRKEATNEIKKLNAVGKIYDILKKLINTKIKEYKQFDRYNAAKQEERENLKKWHEKIKSLKRAFRSLHEYYENKEINLFNKKIKEAGILDEEKIENTIDVKQIIEDIKSTLYDIENFQNLIKNTKTLNEINLIGNTFSGELRNAGEELKKEENKNLLSNFITEIREELGIEESGIDNEENKQEEEKDGSEEINTNKNQNGTMPQNKKNEERKEGIESIDDYYDDFDSNNNIIKNIKQQQKIQQQNKQLNNNNDNIENSNNKIGNKDEKKEDVKIEDKEDENIILFEDKKNEKETSNFKRKFFNFPIIGKAQNQTTSTNTNQNKTILLENIFNQNYKDNLDELQVFNLPIMNIKNKEVYDINKIINTNKQILDNLLSNGIPKNLSTDIENERNQKITNLNGDAIYHILTSEKEIISRNRGNKLTRLFDSRKYRYNEFCELIEKGFKNKGKDLEIPDEKPLKVNEEDFKKVWNEVGRGESLKDVFRDTAFFGCCC